MKFSPSDHIRDLPALSPEATYDWFCAWRTSWRHELIAEKSHLSPSSGPELGLAPSDLSCALGCSSPLWEGLISPAAACLFCSGLEAHEHLSDKFIELAHDFFNLGVEIWVDNNQIDPLLMGALWSHSPSILSSPMIKLWWQKIIERSTPEHWAFVLLGGVFSSKVSSSKIDLEKSHQGNAAPSISPALRREMIEGLVGFIHPHQRPLLMEAAVRHYVLMSFPSMLASTRKRKQIDTKILDDLVVATNSPHPVTDRILRYAWIKCVDFLGASPGSVMATWLIKHAAPQNQAAALLWLSCQDEHSCPQWDALWGALSTISYQPSQPVAPWGDYDDEVEGLPLLPLAAYLARLGPPDHPVGGPLVRSIIDQDALERSLSIKPNNAKPNDNKGQDDADKSEDGDAGQNKDEGKGKSGRRKI